MEHFSASHGAANAEVPGIGEYSSILRKRRRLLFGVALPIVAIGGLLAVGLPDVYESSGHIEIEGAQDIQELVNRASKEDAPYADQYVQTLSTVVLGNKNLSRLLSEHKLYDDQERDPAGSIKRLRSDIDVDIAVVNAALARNSNAETPMNVVSRLSLTRSAIVESPSSVVR